MIFTKTDKTLVDRAARIVHDQAVIEEKMHGPVWSATAEGKDAKRRYDRLLRDERDLRMLARRLEKLVPAAAVPASEPEDDAAARDASNMAAVFGAALELTKKAINS
jgi:hypothetical protein